MKLAQAFVGGIVGADGRMMSLLLARRDSVVSGRRADDGAVSRSRANATPRSAAKSAQLRRRARREHLINL